MQIELVRTITCRMCGEQDTRDVIVHDDEIPDALREGVEECKYPTDSGPCSREVEEGYCWQHSDDE